MVGKFWFMRFEVFGESMLPIFAAKDYLLVFKSRSVKCGDYVVFCDPRYRNRRLLKMVARVNPSEIFVEGLNKKQSTDSRIFGSISKDLIVGKVFMRYYPLFGRGKFWFW